MSAILDEAGMTTVEFPGLEEWVPGRGGVAVVVATVEEASLAAIPEFIEEHPSIPLIAVVADLTVGLYAEAVRAGAVVAVAEDETPEVLVKVIDAALEGRASVPVAVIRAMAARIPVAPDPAAWVSDEEASWLQRMAAGATVADLAEAVGYSEREMFRMLRETYTRIGASNRTEAIIWATRHGLLDG